MLKVSQMLKVMKLKKLFTFYFLLPAALFIGCAGKKDLLKINIPENIKKITIPIFNNKTKKPGFEVEFTDIVKREFLKDGRLEVVNTEKEADAILDVIITNYLNEPLQYDANNVVIQYRLKISVNIRLIDSKDKNKIYWKHDNIGGLTGGTSTYFVSGDTGLNIETEFEARRKVFEKLARDIVNRTIYGWEKY